jgi:hypothetical protein
LVNREGNAVRSALNQPDDCVILVIVGIVDALDKVSLSSIKRERFRCERSSSQVRSKDMVGDFCYLKPIFKVENSELGGIPAISN